MSTLHEGRELTVRLGFTETTHGKVEFCCSSCVLRAEEVDGGTDPSSGEQNMLLERNGVDPSYHASFCYMVELYSEGIMAGCGL